MDYYKITREIKKKIDLCIYEDKFEEVKELQKVQKKIQKLWTKEIAERGFD